MFTLRAVFMGPNGLRAGWRLLIFIAMLIPLFTARARSSTLRCSGCTQKYSRPWEASPCLLVALFLASGITARIEGRSIADYVYPNPAAVPDFPQRL